MVPRNTVRFFRTAARPFSLVFSLLESTPTPEGRVLVSASHRIVSGPHAFILLLLIPELLSSSLLRPVWLTAHLPPRCASGACSSWSGLGLASWGWVWLLCSPSTHRVPVVPCVRTTPSCLRHSPVSSLMKGRRVHVLRIQQIRFKSVC